MIELLGPDGRDEEADTSVLTSSTDSVLPAAADLLADREAAAAWADWWRGAETADDHSLPGTKRGD